MHVNEDMGKEAHGEKGQQGYSGEQEKNSRPELGGAFGKEQLYS